MCDVITNALPVRSVVHQYSWYRIDSSNRLHQAALPGLPAGKDSRVTPSLHRAVLRHGWPRYSCADKLLEMMVL
eukprot:27923-Eustigmatos_ZCMA.PRE.1